MAKDSADGFTRDLVAENARRVAAATRKRRQRLKDEHIVATLDVERFGEISTEGLGQFIVRAISAGDTDLCDALLNEARVRSRFYAAIARSADLKSRR